jgi:dihydropteroate synthase
MQLLCLDRVLNLDQPVDMGVLNVTPDSFSDGGQFLTAEAAIARAELMAQEGAAIIDIGGESTRPGAAPVASDEELRRVLPVVERLAGRVSVLLSIDTSNPELIRRASAAGAHLINDVRALRRPGALEALAGSRLGACLMHMQGEPANMQADPCYGNVVTEVQAFLSARVQACSEAGIARERLCIDPGFGFGKRREHNFALLRQLGQLAAIGLPLAVGLSRKSMLAALTGRGDAGNPAAQRLAGSIALATIAVLQGAQIVRAHDVAATLDALRVASAFRRRS